jgi:hypothetical protein
VGCLLKAVVAVQKRQDLLESKLQEANVVVQDLVSTLMEEAKTKNDKIDRMDKTLEEIRKDFQKLKKEYKLDFTKLSDETKSAKLDLEMAKKEYAAVNIGQKETDIKRQVEQLTQAFIQDELLSDIVKKSIETKIGDVSHELNSIQKLVVDTKSQANEEKDKENRSRNVIIYRVEESDSPSYEIRNKHDKEIVIRLLRELIADDFEESEIQKVFRMGRMGESPKSRPILIQFVSKMTKNYLMESLYRLKKSSFKDLVISHDMTLLERDQCKKMVQEAKNKETADLSGEWIYRVRGLPGLMKVVKWRKHY